MNMVSGWRGLALPLLVILILALVIPIMFRNYKSIKQHVPVEDERTKKATVRAASLSYFISIYLLLAIGWFGDAFFQRPSEATGFAIAVMAVVFIGLLLYYQKRGRL